MRRALATVAIAAIAVAGLLFAQTPEPAVLKSPQGEASISTLALNAQIYVAADDFVKAMGGTIEPDGGGFKVTLLGKLGAFAPDNQYGVVRDELIAMPALPVVIEGRAFVPWQFFRGFLATAGDLELDWNAQQRVFTVSQRVRQSLTAGISVIDLDDTTKVVVQLSGKTEFTISRRQQSYVVKLGNPIGAPFVEQAYQNPHLARVLFRSNEIELQLTGADVVGSAYRLDDPFRVVLDLRRGAPVATGTPGAINLPQQHLPGIRTIVIDPGHGGSDTGAIGPNGIEEKTLTLAIAKKLSASLSRTLKARVVLTRETDELIPLTQRTALANEYKADLFLSIHLNSSLRKGAQGTETYFLSLDASDELAKQVAERENEEGAAPASVAAPEGDLRFILWDLAQQEYLKESSELAETIQDELSKATNTENRGVKQAPFRVLIGATMPAALVELGFISNPDEEAKLKDVAYQDKLVEAVVTAVERFKGVYETRIGVATPAAPPAPAIPAPATPAPATPPPASSTSGTGR